MSALNENASGDQRPRSDETGADEPYSPWPKDGCTLQAAFERTIDPDLRDASVQADKELKAAGGASRRTIRLYPLNLLYDEDPRERRHRERTERYHNRLRQDADTAKRALASYFRNLLLSGRLVATGLFNTPSASRIFIPAHVWKFLRVVNWKNSIAEERTRHKDCWYEIRVFPAVLAPDPVELLAGRSLQEAFRMFVLDDPEVVAWRLRALKAAPDFERVFINGHCYVHGAAEWPLAYAGRQITGASRFGLERDWADLLAPDYPPIVVAAAEALAHRYRCLIDLLRRGELEAIGVLGGSGQVVPLIRSIWSHENFYLNASGDVLEENPNCEDPPYDRLIKRWSAVMLQRPSGSSMSAIAATGWIDMGNKPATSQERAEVSASFMIEDIPGRECPTSETARAQAAPTRAMAQSTSRIELQNACKDWLVSQMRAHPQRRVGTKPEWFEKAREQWPNLSERGFKSAWTQAIAISGASAWSASGAPRRESARRTD